MIQVTNARRTSTSVTSARSDSRSELGESSEQHWGKWFNAKHYSLEVIQNPIRARMCGFGDKVCFSVVRVASLINSCVRLARQDRRPLAPAAVAKMTIRREDNTIVDIDEIDVAFFIVTVDLWSADGKQEMNLVLHPSSVDRYIPTHISKTRRRGNGQNASSSAPDSQSSQPSLQALPPPAAAYAHAQNQSAYPGYHTHPGPPHPGMPDPNLAPYPAHPPYAHYPDHAAWGYPPYPPYQHPGYPGYPLPSIHSFHRTGTPAWHMDPASRGEAGPPPPPPPPPGPSTSMEVGPGSTYANSPTTHLPPPPHGYVAYGAPPPPVDGGPMYATQPYGPPPGHYYAHAPPPPPPLEPAPVSVLTHQPQSQLPVQGQGQGQGQVSSGSGSGSARKTSSVGVSADTTPSSPSTPAPALPLPRHTYTRTLVGPLSANAARLNDEHRKPGVFFLFQDLSIRTEGTFRLRLRLMNVGAYPAPDPGANRVMEGSAPILAQTFTEAFTVYSAKRFPGVPDTTALSIAFGNQGQKLPLRNRHGSRQTGRRRRRGESDGSEDDSDRS
ncbi:velvet factor-domain-containing protein [Phellopilus nigrolimitatus]|nr:velvet factor-domain-containing protein [Phellopilus nigrolimitatus]